MFVFTFSFFFHVIDEGKTCPLLSFYLHGFSMLVSCIFFPFCLLLCIFRITFLFYSSYSFKYCFSFMLLLLFVVLFLSFVLPLLFLLLLIFFLLHLHLPSLFSFLPSSLSFTLHNIPRVFLFPVPSLLHYSLSPPLPLFPPLHSFSSVHCLSFHLF